MTDYEYIIIKINLKTKTKKFPISNDFKDTISQAVKDFLPDWIFISYNFEN